MTLVSRLEALNLKNAISRRSYDTQKNTVNINDREELKKLHTNDDMRNK